MATNSLGFITKYSEVANLTVSDRPLSIVLVGTTGVNGMIGKTSPGLAVPGTAYDIYAAGTTTPLVFPAGYTIYRTDVQVVHAPDNAGHVASIALGTNLSGVCINAAEAIASWPVADSLIVANAPAHVVSASLTEKAQYTVSNSATALTAGEMTVYYNLFTAAV